MSGHNDIDCSILPSAIITIYVGLIVNFNGNDKLNMCLLGNRLLQEDGSGNCTKEVGSQLYKTFCTTHNELDGMVCDDYFIRHNATRIKGIRGLASGVIKDNIWPSFMQLVRA